MPGIVHAPLQPAMSGYIARSVKPSRWPSAHPTALSASAMEDSRTPHAAVHTAMEPINSRAMTCLMGPPSDVDLLVGRLEVIGHAFFVAVRWSVGAALAPDLQRRRGPPRSV